MPTATCGEKKEPTALLEDFNLRVEFSELDLLERLGAGSFGQVFECLYRGTPVAAKCVKHGSIHQKWAQQHARNVTAQASSSAAIIFRSPAHLFLPLNARR